MRITKIESIQFKTNATENKKQQRELIDIIADNVKNPRDVEDCVAVPRGIFKAYIALMAGSSMGLIANVLPQKWKYGKLFFNVCCAVLSAISAVFFAKPFAVKGLSPTIKKEDINKS